MAKVAEERKKKRKALSAKKWASTQQSGGRTAISLPEGVSLIQQKDVGTRLFNIIPYTVGKGNPSADEGELHFERTYWMHFGIGPNNGAYVCPAKTVNKRCPICDYRAKMQMKATGDEEKKQIKNLAPKQRQLFNVEDCEDRAKGIQLWDLSSHNFGDLLVERTQAADEDDEEEARWQFFADPVDGSMLKITFGKEPTGSGGAYYPVSAIDFRKRKIAIGDELLEKAMCLDDLLIIKEYDDLEAIFLQIEKGSKNAAATDEEDDEPEEKPRKKKKPLVEDEDDLDVDGGNDSDDEDEEPEAPKRRKKKSEPVEEDEDDEEEPEPPKRRKKKAAVEEEPDEDEEEDEPAPPKRKKKGKPEPVEEEEDEPEEEKPRKKKKPSVDPDEDWDD